MVLPDFEYMAPRTIGEVCNLLLELGPQGEGVAHAAKVVASTQIRAKATMVGNMCNASPSADTPPILLAQNARVLVHTPNGERYIMMDDFFVGFKKTALEPGEIVTGLVIPPLKPNEHCAYIKHAVRKAMDLAIVGVAVMLTMDSDVCTDAKVTMGAVAIKAVHAPSAEKALIGRKLTPEVIAEASVAAMEDAKPISDIRASAEYRKDMIRVFTKRAIMQALEG